MRVNDFPLLPSEMKIFGVANPLAHHSEAIFYSLKHVSLTGPQKDFIADQCQGVFGDYPDIRFGDSARKLKIRYDLSESTVCSWIKHRKVGEHNTALLGRQSSIDVQGMIDHFANVSKGKNVKGHKAKNTKALFTKQEVNRSLNQHYRETLVRKGYDIDVNDEDLVLSRNTFKKINKKVFYWNCNIY